MENLLRIPNKRTHPRGGGGHRGTPRPPPDAALRGRIGYVINNHIREVRLQTATAAASLYARRDVADAARLPLLRDVQARSLKDAAASATAAGKDSPLLLAQSQVRDLMAANRRKDEFLALLAHELRSPLCAIGYAAALMGTRPTEKGDQQSLQALIERQVLRMTHLVDEVLDVSRVTHGLLTLQSERVNVSLIVMNAIETLQSEIKGRNQRLNSDMPEVPVWVLGDERRLEQVFVNLIANASRYTDEGGKLAISMHVEAGAAVIHVQDSGIGIAPDSLLGIFELFRQADAADPRSKSGLGVGLALVRQLVELHGGKVTAASEGLGRGSVFTIALPVFSLWLPAATETSAEDEELVAPAPGSVASSVTSGALHAHHALGAESLGQR